MVSVTWLMVFSWNADLATAVGAAGTRAMSVGRVLKLNLDAVGIRDEQLGRVAAPRYLGAADAEVGKSPHHSLGIEIRNRHAVGEEIGFCAAPDRRQSKEVRTLADAKHDGIALPDRRTEQTFIEGRGALQIRNGDHDVVQAPGLKRRSRLLRHQTR